MQCCLLCLCAWEAGVQRGDEPPSSTLLAPRMMWVRVVGVALSVIAGYAASASGSEHSASDDNRLVRDEAVANTHEVSLVLGPDSTRATMACRAYADRRAGWTMWLSPPAVSGPRR